MSAIATFHTFLNVAGPVRVSIEDDNEQILVSVTTGLSGPPRNIYFDYEAFAIFAKTVSEFRVHDLADVDV